MSLENNIERIAAALETIAQAMTAGASTTIKPVEGVKEDVKTSETKTKKSAKKKASTKKPSDSDESGSDVDDSDSVPEETAVDDDDDVIEGESEEVIEDVTPEMLRDLAQQALKAGKKDECKAIITSTGHDRISSLPDEDLAGVYVALKELVEAE